MTDFVPYLGRLILLKFILGISLTALSTNETRLSK